MNATGLLNRLLYFEAIGAAGTVYILKIHIFRITYQTTYEELITLKFICEHWKYLLCSFDEKLETIITDYFYTNSYPAHPQYIPPSLYIKKIEEQLVHPTTYNKRDSDPTQAIWNKNWSTRDSFTAPTQ